MDRYNAFGRHVKERFGQKVYKINIDAGFTCPNRDGTLGTGGCIYCNNDSFRPSSCTGGLGVREQVENGASYLARRYGARKYLAYFQAYTNTYGDVEHLRSVYSEALENPDVLGLAIGTRPDCIDGEKLDMLAEIGREKFVLLEYGLQSVYEKSLEFMRRGHGVEKFLWAVEETRKRGLEAGVHLIAGFPTESREEMLDMARVVSGWDVGFLKLHQLQIVEGTPLAELYRREPFYVFEYEDYLDFAVEFVRRLDPRIVLQRLFATAPEDILIAPEWGRSRHEILRGINQRFEDRDARQGDLAAESRRSRPEPGRPYVSVT